MSYLEPACTIGHLGPAAYQGWRASELGATTERLEQEVILDLVGPVAGSRLLDVGCGDGALAVTLAADGAHVVGVDPSEPMIRAASMRAREASGDLKLCLGRAEALPFAPASFDLVVAMTVLCFVPDAIPMFREIGRVLRPGGQLVIGELGKYSPWAIERRLRGWLGSQLWRQGRFRTKRELFQLAREGGLQPDKVRGAIYYPRQRLAARWLAPFDRKLSDATTIGAAFIALSAHKQLA